MRIVLPPLLLLPVLAAQETPHLDLKVLYAGVPGHARTQQWREFLAKHTQGVAVVDVTQLGDDVVSDADVVILDCPDPLVRNAEGQVQSIKVPRAKALTTRFSRPTIVVGGMVMLTDGLHLKSNWL